ncbi:TadE/TadG family type IV pilus assembly protein [Caldalkalibacillus mannanilyticus]|uniref:TadE/TadG family type IV pilus assembly protein n=1 Tax=Caldalkalibacillus mannanilyticus TaxID=1418 RepID=UPI00046A04E5|nr:hypothetical protein [Caldalkalibacillus mannanilyticus]
MKNLYQSERGSVSIFLLIIVLAIFLFHAVLIDYARIMAANKQADTALKTGVRSVLSSYDHDLQAEYGIFGLSIAGAETEAIFHHVVEQNLLLLPETFRLVDQQLDSSSILVKADHFLGKHEVYKQQILEEMKYRAPIEYTLGVVERLEPISQATRETSIAIEAISEIKPHFLQREAYLERGEEKVQYIYQRMEQAQQRFLSEGTYIAEHSLEETLSMMEYVRQMFVQAKRENSLMAEHLRQGQQEQQKLKVQFENDVADVASVVFPHASPHTVPIEDREAIRSMLQNWEQKILEDRFFSLLEERLDQQKAMILAWQAEEESLMDGARTGDGFAEENHGYIMSFLEQSLALLEEQLDQLNSGMTSHGKKQKQRQFEQAITLGFRKIGQALETFDQPWKDQPLPFKEIEKTAKKYQQLNSLSHQPIAPLEWNPHPFDMTVEALQKMSLLFLSVAERLETERDQILVNEYLLERFSVPEYIMYGLERSEENQKAALSKIAMLRLAVNMMDAVTLCLPEEEPLTVYECVMATGSEKTAEQIERLKAGQAVEASKYLPSMQMDSIDHLRIVLLLHQHTHTLSRMQALTEYDTGKDLSQIPTYIKANIQTEFRLWFLPGVMKALGYTGVIEGKVKGSIYQIEKQYSASY